MFVNFKSYVRLVSEAPLEKFQVSSEGGVIPQYLTCTTTSATDNATFTVGSDANTSINWEVK